MIVELEKQTLHHLLTRSFEQFTDLPAFAFVGEKPLTYGKIQKKVNATSFLLLQHGVKKSDKVAILGENSPNWVIAYMAAVNLGAVAVPILPGFTEEDTRHIIRDSGAVAIFITEKQKDKIASIEKANLNVIISLENFDIELLAKSQLRGLDRHIKSLLSEYKDNPSDPAWVQQYTTPEESDLAVIIYTSGTTGHSKGVMLTHKNIASDVVLSVEQFPINKDDRFLSILPLPHTFECTGGMMCPLAVGASIFYMDGLPTPQKLLSAMETVQPTAVLTVPLVMDKIYRKRVMPQIRKIPVLGSLYSMAPVRKTLNKLAGKKLLKTFGGKLRFFMFGGAALNEDVEVFLRDAGISYSTGYGMTETAPILTINPFGRVRVGSCGQPIPGIEIKIHEPNQETDIGEIIVRGPNVMQGYYKNPSATKTAFLSDNWLRTGDLGYFDDEGYLFIKGRSKNVIVGPSGENIYPEIIEQALTQSPYIQEVVVYAADNHLCAMAYPDYDLIDKDLQEMDKSSDCSSYTAEILHKVRKETNEMLPRFFAVKKIFEQTEPFEKTPTNKVKRYLYIPKK